MDPRMPWRAWSLYVLLQKSIGNLVGGWVEPTQLKNISQIGSFPQVGLKLKDTWNHHLELRVSNHSWDNQPTGLVLTWSSHLQGKKKSELIIYLPWNWQVAPQEKHPKRKGKSLPSHQFSGLNSLLVSGRVSHIRRNFSRDKTQLLKSIPTMLPSGKLT